MEPAVWPLYDLRITTPRLELRLPDLDELSRLAAVAAAGVHDEDRMPFVAAWTDVSPEERARATFQHLLGTVAGWTPRKWSLGLAVSWEGKVVGRQDLGATDFAVTGEAHTGSWLGQAYQGRGIGTEMRAAVLHLAFEGLGAHSMTSGAMADNARSLRVSEKLGYRPDGREVLSVRGEARDHRRLRLDRAGWEAHRTVPVELHGLEPSLALFGL
ncbi:GNAT family N-acetyltransferase [Streptomyces niveus]|uniref:GNAT family N-acetyltransferase n=1 Tax=Streptomyces niveus TaxID=193462 RepID=UPI0036C1528C